MKLTTLFALFTIVGAFSSASAAITVTITGTEYFKAANIIIFRFDTATLSGMSLSNSQFTVSAEITTGIRKFISLYGNTNEMSFDFDQPFHQELLGQSTNVAAGATLFSPSIGTRAWNPILNLPDPATNVTWEQWSSENVGTVWEFEIFDTPDVIHAISAGGVRFQTDAIPEPSSVLFGLLSSLGFLTRRRR